MKFVIFDIDGTLANTKKVDDKSFIEAFQQTFNIDISNQIWEDIKNVTEWGITEEIIESKLGRKPTSKEYKVMISNVVTLLKKEKQNDHKQFNDVRGAKDFFTELLLRSDLGVGIATGAWEESAKIKLEAINIGLDGICFSNSDHHISREAITTDVIDQLKKKHGLIPTEIIYFGDGAWDYKTCKNLGIRFIGIDIESDGKLIALGAKTVFKDFSNKEHILEEIFKDINTNT